MNWIPFDETNPPREGVTYTVTVKPADGENYVTDAFLRSRVGNTAHFLVGEGSRVIAYEPKPEPFEG